MREQMNSTPSMIKAFPLSDHDLAKFVLEQTDTAIVLCDADATIVLANPAARVLYAGDPLGLRFDAAFPFEAVSDAGAQDAVKWSGAFSLEPVLQGQPVQGLVQWAREGGAPRYLVVKAAPCRGADARTACCLVAMNNVTQLQTLARDAARLAAIVRDSEDAILSKDLEGTILSWNPAAERLYGYTAQEIIGQSVTILFPPERLDEFHSIMERLRRGESIQHYDTLRVRKDGTRVDVSITISPLRHANGVIIGASTISRNIAERKALEHARQNAINILNAVVEGTTDGVYVKDRAGRYLMINHAGAQALGRAVSEIEGKYDYELFDHAVYQRIRSDDERIMARGAPETVEEQLPTPHGVRIFQSVKAPYRDADGNLTGVISVSRDVTALRRDEAALARHAALLDLSPSAISVQTREGKITYWNRGAEKIYGWSADEAIGKMQRELLQTQADMAPQLIEAALLAEGHWHGELHQRTRTGKPLVVASDQVVQYDERGKPIAVLQVNQDITERKRSEIFQQFLVEATDGLSVSLNMDVALQTIADQAVPFFADWCAIHILTEDGMIERVAFAHADPVARERTNRRPQKYPLDLRARHLAAYVIRTGATEFFDAVPDGLLEQAARDPDHLEMLRALGVKSYLCLPLRARGNMLGAVTFALSESGRQYTRADLDFAAELVRRAGLAVDNARLYQEMQALNAELEARVSQRTYELSEAYDELRREVAERTRAEETMRTLLRISNELNSTLDVQSVLDILIREALKMMGGVRGFAGLRTERGMTVAKLAQDGETRPFEYTWERGRGLPGWVLEHGQPYVTNDAANDSIMESDLPLHENVSSAICTPVFDMQGQVIAFFEILDKQDGGTFTGADVEFLMSLAPLASIAIQNALAYQQILRAEMALQESNRQLRALAARIETIREEERRDIARELHDELGQALTALKMDLSAMLNRPPKRAHALRERAQAMSDQIDATIKTVRRLSSQLRPGMLDDLGLAPSIEWYAHEFQTRTGIECRVAIPTDDLEVEPKIATALFRIFQETLTNVARHANAKHVDVQLQGQDGVLMLRIQDDGDGIDLTQARVKRSLGLLGMRERAEMIQGTLEIHGAPGAGTTVLVQVPLSGASESDPTGSETR
jgi:PAS domain S-box-containing protein